MVQAQDITTERDPQRNSEESRNAPRSRRQRFGALAWILVLGLQLYWILWDIPILSPPSLSLAPTKVRPLGEMLSTQNEVRTQGANDVVWEKAGSPSEVYSGSRVMTLEKAEAQILLREHGTLTLKENTLVALEGFETPSASLGSGKLKLLKGDLQLKVAARDRPMDITLTTPAGDRAIRVAPGSEIRSSSNRFEVVAGTVTDLETQAAFNDGQTIEIRADTQGKAVLEPIAKPTPEPSPTPTPSPTPSPVAKPSPKPSPKPTPKPASKKPKPAPKKTLPAPKLKAPAIRKKKSAAYRSEPRSSVFDWLFPSAHASAPALYEPLEIDLTWELVPEARGYRLQIAKDRGFKRVILDREVSRPPFTWDYEPGMENSLGRVFYRVSALTTDPATSSQFSVAEVLVIPKVEPVVAAPPPPPPPPKPAPKSVAAAKPASPETKFAVGVAIRKFTQESATRDLEEVTENSPYFHQTLKASHSRPKIRADLELRYTKWKSNSTRHSSQAEITSLDGTVSSSRWALTRWGRSLLRWELGALIARATRFEKNSRSTIEASPGYAFGAIGALALDGWRAKLTLPVSGLLFGSYWGAEALLEKEIPWGNFFLLPEARYALQTWDTPKDTEVREWSAGASLGYRF